MVDRDLRGILKRADLLLLRFFSYASTTGNEG